jgi:hypothetical protein
LPDSGDLDKSGQAEWMYQRGERSVFPCRWPDTISGSVFMQCAAYSGPMPITITVSMTSSSATASINGDMTDFLHSFDIALYEPYTLLDAFWFHRVAYRKNSTPSKP